MPLGNAGEGEAARGIRPHPRSQETCPDHRSAFCGEQKTLLPLPAFACRARGGIVHGVWIRLQSFSFPFLSQNTDRLGVRAASARSDRSHRSGPGSRHGVGRRSRRVRRSRGRRDCRSAGGRSRHLASDHRGRWRVHARHSIQNAVRAQDPSDRIRRRRERAGWSVERRVARCDTGCWNDVRHAGRDRITRSGEPDGGDAVALGDGPRRHPGPWLDRTVRRPAVRPRYERRGNRSRRWRADVALRPGGRLRLQRRPDRWRAGQPRWRPLRFQSRRRRRDRARGGPAWSSVLPVGRGRHDVGRADRHEAREPDGRTGSVRIVRGWIVRHLSRQRGRLWRSRRQDRLPRGRHRPQDGWRVLGHPAGRRSVQADGIRQRRRRRDRLVGLGSCGAALQRWRWQDSRTDHIWRERYGHGLPDARPDCVRYCLSHTRVPLHRQRKRQLLPLSRPFR